MYIENIGKKSDFFLSIFLKISRYFPTLLQSFMQLSDLLHPASGGAGNPG